jgi:transposase-like protein
MLAESVANNKENLPVRVMFQDEARFGRMSDPRRCWAPWPLRPLVKKALIREYVYAYAAVTPADGQLDWMLGSKMDTPTMNVFLRQVSQNCPEEFVVMVLDGAPSHRSAQLEIPENMVLLRLPPYSPELNPAERLWDELREKEFANKVFDSLDSAVAQLALGMWRLESSPAALQSLTGWDWILESS